MLNTKWVMFYLYQVEKYFDKMICDFTFELNLLKQLGVSFYWDNSRFRVNMSFLSFLNVVFLKMKKKLSILYRLHDFGLSRSEIEHTIARSRVEHANHYNIQAVILDASMNIHCYQDIINTVNSFNFVDANFRGVRTNCIIKDWSQFLFGSWRNNLNQVVHTV